jgi:hypothetical protein
MADDIDRVFACWPRVGWPRAARPAHGRVREDDAIYFLTDARHHKDQDNRPLSKVCLAFADTSGPWGAGRELKSRGL